MRVAVLWDIHANLPAPESVLEEIHHADASLVVLGGDVLPGPMPRETLTPPQALDVALQGIHGNGQLTIVPGVDSTRY
jgi:predicted phosphodiesterase